MMINGMTCQHCKKWNDPAGIVESLHRFVDGRIHVRSECQYCRSFLKYTSYSESYTVKNILHKVYRKESLENILDGVVIYDDKTQQIL